MHKHAVAGSGASTLHLFCNQTVHRYGLSFTVRLTLIISYPDWSTCLFSVARRPVSPVTLIRHCHRCKKKSTVPEFSSLSSLLTALLAAPCPSECSLSPETEKVRSPKNFQHKVRELSALLQSCLPAANFPRRRTFKNVSRNLGQFFTTIYQRQPVLQRLACNVCVCDVAGFRSCGLSHETKRWFYKNTTI